MRITLMLLKTMAEIDPNQLEHHLGFLLGDCQRLFSTVLDRRMRSAELDLNRAQWRVIAHLARDDGMTQTQLALSLDMERAPLGSLLDKLETAGWIERRADKQDRRVNRVFVTKAGHEVQPLLWRECENLIDEMTQGLSAEQLNQLCLGLHLLKQNLLVERQAGDE